MADREHRLPVNAPGRFYTDDSCIDCDMCRQTAPDNFARSDEIHLSFVFHQPSTPDEEELCRMALDGCPTDSIGDDGGAALPKT